MPSDGSRKVALIVLASKSEEILVAFETGRGGVTLRHPRVGDGGAVHGLIGRCPPLDQNSRYACLLICGHFASTSVVAQSADGKIAGYISGYLKPEDPEALFVWQVAVDPEERGNGLGASMLEWLLNSSSCRGMRFLETTITPSNEASWRLFRGLARRRRAGFRSEAWLDESLFGDENHERENLVRIGPFDG